MTRGKETCKILKEIRQQIADKNEIEYVTSECHFQGECRGTCPQCEDELQYIEKELHKRRQLGKAVAIAGISLGIAGTFSACNTPQKQPNTPISEQEIAADTVSIDTISINTMDTILAPTPPLLIDIVGDVHPLDGIIAKREVIEGEMPFMFVEVMPEYIGGEEARIRFLKENLVYPEEAKEKGIEGRVTVSFIVEIDGSLTDIKIVRGVHPILDNEAIRGVKLMPKWKAGHQRGKPVRVQFQMPITFSLED